MGFGSPGEGRMPPAPCAEVCWLFIHPAPGFLVCTKVSSLWAPSCFLLSLIPAPLWDFGMRVPHSLDGLLRTPGGFCWLSLPCKVLCPSFLRPSAVSSAGSALPSPSMCFFPSTSRGSLWISLLPGSREQGLIFNPKSTAPSVSCLWGVAKSPVLQKGFPCALAEPGTWEVFNEFSLVAALNFEISVFSSATLWG